MGSKINIRARIERHSRVLQHTLYEKGKHTGKIGITIVSCFSIFLFPFYPVLASFAGGANEFNFSRLEIDEDSIIDSFQLAEGSMLGDGTVFIQSVDSYLQVNASTNGNGNTTRASRTIIEHEVLGGQNLGSIANQYGVSIDTIRWENNLANDNLRPGQILRILPTSGLSHKVASGETLSGLAQRYKVSQEDIMRQNLLLSASELRIGDTIIIPGAIIEPPKPAPRPTPAPQPQRNTSPNRAVANTSTPPPASSAPATANTQGRYQLVWRQPQWTFFWGNCTWYVAQYKNVNWSGNANQWLRNARAKGHATGNTPTLGAIVQLEGRGYNPRYGHVGIVIDYTDTHIIVSDMNYRRLGEVTTRQIPRNDTTIQGYIYVD